MKKSVLVISGTVFFVALISFCLGIHLYTTKYKLPIAEKIIEKNLKATGGKKAHEKIQNRMEEMNVSVVTYGMEYKTVIYMERDNRNYVLADIDAMGEIKYGSDGNVTWEISPLTGTRVLEGEELANRLFDIAFDGVVTWKTLCKSVKTEGIEDVNGSSCYKVVFTPEEGSPREVYFDKKSFLAVKIASEVKYQNESSRIETFLEDYRKVGDILLPHKITVSSMGQVVQNITVERIEYNIEMPEGIFDLPEKIKKLLTEKKEDSKVDKSIPVVFPVVKIPEPSTFEMDLSPATWDPAEVGKYNQLNMQMWRGNDLFEGENAVIVGANSPQAQRAGLEALRRGGNAMDAALTTSLTHIALNAGAPVSYAGVMEMVYYDSATDRYYNLNAGWNTLLEEDDPMSIPRGSGLDTSAKPNPSGRSALAPGYMAGVEAAHKRFGKLPFSALFTPAIYYAEKGFELPMSVSGWISTRRSILSRLPETKRVFTKKETGSFFRAGELFCQPELAATLRAVADQGAAYMYTDEWAEKLVAMVRRDGGKMTMEDLENYQAIWSEPLEIPYGDYTIYAPGLPAVGGVNIAQALNVASEAGLSNMGHYSKSPEAFFWLFQINNLSIITMLPKAYRSNLLGGVDASLPSMVNKTHAKHLWAMMSGGQFGMTKTPIQKDPKHSDAIVVIDQWGNVAALVHTINTLLWGETGIFVDGVSIADPAASQQQLILETGPGKRLPDGMEPLIISRDGKPFIALASIGGGLHQATNSVLFNIMDFNMDLKEAINAPSLHTPKFLASGAIIPQVYSADFSHELLAGVKELGLEVEVMPYTGGSPGWVIGAMIDPDGLRKAVPSLRGNGVALGY